eukprot:TRINITY_DN65893_c0_g1_i1.p1 TRINITY_DN65893_c0_g1~~TRINITY_DN65893_c0_g1_i1.p1  ORF type:complete len:204 (-),score=22.08 TRINITY_DN65893_c0_g1_i1:96-707(-)
MLKLTATMVCFLLLALEATSASAGAAAVSNETGKPSLRNLTTSRSQTCEYGNSEYMGYFGGSYPNRFHTKFRRDERITRIELGGWYVVDKIFIHATHHQFWIGRYQPTMASIDVDDDEELLSIRLCETMHDAHDGNGPQMYIGHIMFVTTKGQVVKVGQSMDGICVHIPFAPGSRLSVLYGSVGTYPSYLHSIGIEQWRGCGV